MRTAPDDTWSDLFSRILIERVEPRLGRRRAALLHAYPASEAALAEVDPADPRVAERFELYACGVELANAFHELTDAHEQRKRFEADMAEQRRIYGASPPIDEDFLAAVSAMPDACGRGARLRPAGHARDRRRRVEDGPMDAGRRSRD